MASTLAMKYSRLNPHLVFGIPQPIFPFLKSLDFVICRLQGSIWPTTVAAPAARLRPPSICHCGPCRDWDHGSGCGLWPPGLSSCCFRFFMSSPMQCFTLRLCVSYFCCSIVHLTGPVLNNREGGQQTVTRITT